VVTLVRIPVRSLFIHQDSQVMLLVVQLDSQDIMTSMAIARRLASLVMFILVLFNINEQATDMEIRVKVKIILKSINRLQFN